MGLKDMFEDLKKEVKVVQGEETKDKEYSNHNEFADEATAIKEFERSKKKLFAVNTWSKIAGSNSEFRLYDERGRRTTAEKPEIGYYIEIILPASTIDNWVKVTAIREEANLAEFVVHPSEKPQERGQEEKVIEHFFIKEASSTFRVMREGKTLHAYEIGRNEGINNRGDEAGDRALLNTLVAEGGWAGVQALQWGRLTRYLVHLDELEQPD
ncbi:hypothetical protein DXT99_11910 [Pontibacter diazotrophicus]|uniref:Uncharacterized protein n=1 Tax=Pontibacter diazotrophicus TaxID=1400979 RepID=A0A3D8LDF5_9BACT|nr:hypothetical protein [Pontibacter diazotrophicus]RDV14982.1 hypothetical protein DXT99_11910 [Pontibacter diazotrophicus]